MCWLRVLPVTPSRASCCWRSKLEKLPGEPPACTLDIMWPELLKRSLSSAAIKGPVRFLLPSAVSYLYEEILFKSSVAFLATTSLRICELIPPFYLLLKSWRAERDSPPGVYGLRRSSLLILAEATVLTILRMPSGPGRLPWELRLRFLFVMSIGG